MTTHTHASLPPLIERLPPVRGRLTANAPLASITWFRTGGPAEVLFKPADQDDLCAFLRAKPADVPVTLLGVGSNILVRDGGIPGVVVRLGRAFAAIDIEETQIIAGAGALDINIALSSRNASIGGLEFLSGIPGTLGGALRMNAGAFGKEIKDVLVWVDAINEQGELLRLSAAEMGLSYRHCSMPADTVFLRACLNGTHDEIERISANIEAIRTERERAQPVKVRTGGSTFANPAGHKAWQLIDAAGCRGLRRGDAMISDKHCNFLINTDAASAADIEALGEEVRRRVHEQSGIMLEWEIRRIGIPAPEGVKS